MHRYYSMSKKSVRKKCGLKKVKKGYCEALALK